MKTRLFAALVSLTAATAGLTGCGDDSILGPSVDRPRDRLSLESTTASSTGLEGLTVVQQMQLATLTGYRVIALADMDNPSFEDAQRLVRWQQSFRAYLDSTVPLGDLVACIDAVVNGEVDGPVTMTWLRKFTFAREVGFRVPSLASDPDVDPSAEDAYRLTTWSASFERFLQSIALEEIIRGIEDISDAI